jgi:hypothetical protein
MYPRCKQPTFHCPYPLLVHCFTVAVVCMQEDFRGIVFAKKGALHAHGGLGTASSRAVSVASSSDLK